MSPGSVVRNLLHAHDLLAEQLGRRRVINLPVDPRRRYDSSTRAGRRARDNLAYPPAARPLTQIVSRWPGNFAAEYAKSLVFTADTDFADIIHAFTQDQHISALAED